MARKRGSTSAAATGSRQRPSSVAKGLSSRPSRSSTTVQRFSAAERSRGPREATKDQRARAAARQAAANIPPAMRSHRRRRDAFSPPLRGRADSGEARAERGGAGHGAPGASEEGAPSKPPASDK